MQALLRAPSSIVPPATAEAEAVVSIENLTKRFPIRRPLRQAVLHPFGAEWISVLDRVTFRIRSGEIFGLLGPNGAGKTTLFKILSTIVDSDGGTASVAGFDVMQSPMNVRRVLSSVIPDERSLMWRLSANENLRLYAALHGLRGPSAVNRVGQLLELVGLSDAGETMVGQFSSGMRQRLLLARGLLPHPMVLLLDEPTRSLDPVSAREFREFIRTSVAGHEGCTILIATHSTEEALELCGRVAILDSGRVLAVGTPEALALEVFRERYRLWTTESIERVAALLICNRFAGDITTQESLDHDWNVLEMEIRGGPRRAAEVISVLVSEGIPVGRFEQVRPSLAQLIERVVHGAAEEDPRA